MLHSADGLWPKRTQRHSLMGVRDDGSSTQNTSAHNAFGQPFESLLTYPKHLELCVGVRTCYPAPLHKCTLDHGHWSSVAGRHEPLLLQTEQLAPTQHLVDSCQPGP